MAEYKCLQCGSDELVDTTEIGKIYTDNFELVEIPGIKIIRCNICNYTMATPEMLAHNRELMRKILNGQ